MLTRLAIHTINAAFSTLPLAQSSNHGPSVKACHPSFPAVHSLIILCLNRISPACRSAVFPYIVKSLGIYNPSRPPDLSDPACPALRLFRLLYAFILTITANFQRQVSSRTWTSFVPSILLVNLHEFVEPVQLRGLCRSVTNARFRWKGNGQSMHGSLRGTALRVKSRSIGYWPHASPETAARTETLSTFGIFKYGTLTQSESNSRSRIKLVVEQPFLVTISTRQYRVV